MPSLPGRTCSTPGCRGTAQGTYCGACRAAKYRAQDTNRDTSKDRGYDQAHKRLRLLCFERDGWKCVDCGWEPTVIRQCREFGLNAPPLGEILKELAARKNANQKHLHGEHQIPIEQRPDLRLELENYRTRCSTCHNAKTKLG